MTPDDVVARARELEDQEVLLTVRGTVRHFEGDQWGVYRGVPFTVMLNTRDGVHSDLVSIEPAPLRIEDGCIYTDDDGQVWAPLRPADDTTTWLMHEVRTGLTNVPQGSIRGLRLAKVVPA